MFSDLNIFRQILLSFDVVKTELHMFIMTILSVYMDSYH